MAAVTLLRAHMTPAEIKKVTPAIPATICPTTSGAFNQIPDTTSKAPTTTATTHSAVMFRLMTNLPETAARTVER